MAEMNPTRITLDAVSEAVAWWKNAFDRDQETITALVAALERADTELEWAGFKLDSIKGVPGFVSVRLQIQQALDLARGEAVPNGWAGGPG